MDDLTPCNETMGNDLSPLVSLVSGNWEKCCKGVAKFDEGSECLQRNDGTGFLYRRCLGKVLAGLDAATHAIVSKLALLPPQCT